MRLYLDHLDEQARQRNQRQNDWAEFLVKLLCGSSSGKDTDPLADLHGDELLDELIAICGSEEIGRSEYEKIIEERNSKNEG